MGEEAVFVIVLGCVVMEERVGVTDTGTPLFGYEIIFNRNGNEVVDYLVYHAYSDV